MAMRRGLTRLRQRMPPGGWLPEPEWRTRHRLVVLALVGHLPFLVGYALALGRSPVAAVLEPAGIAALAFLAAWPGSRLRRSLSAAIGLMGCSALLAQLADGAIQARFHSFVVLILVALYQDWRPFAAAVVTALGTSLLEYVTLAGSRDTAGLTLVQGGYLLAAGVALIGVFERSARVRRREQRYGHELLAAEMAVLTRVREAGQIREDLIASVSHEFRTPLTAIHGAAATLRAQGDRIRPEDRDALLTGILEHGERLSRLLEDMLSAASASAADPTAVSDVTAAVLSQRRHRRLTVMAASGLAAYIDRQALGQLMDGLVHHGLTHSRHERPVELTAGTEDRQVILLLRYDADSAVAEDVRQLVEPFGSRECAVTGRPASLGLFLARRLAEVHGGSAQATADGTVVTVVVRLRALRTPARPADPARRRIDEVARTS